jgi:hypothetical protein
MDFRKVVEMAKASYSDRCRRGRAAITPSIAKQAAFHLGIGDSAFLGVVDLLK